MRLLDEEERRGAKGSEKEQRGAKRSKEERRGAKGSEDVKLLLFADDTI